MINIASIINTVENNLSARRAFFQEIPHWKDLGLFFRETESDVFSTARIHKDHGDNFRFETGLNFLGSDVMVRAVLSSTDEREHTLDLTVTPLEDIPLSVPMDGGWFIMDSMSMSLRCVLFDFAADRIMTSMWGGMKGRLKFHSILMDATIDFPVGKKNTWLVKVISNDGSGLNFDFVRRMFGTDFCDEMLPHGIKQLFDVTSGEMILEFDPMKDLPSLLSMETALVPVLNFVEKRFQLYNIRLSFLTQDGDDPEKMMKSAGIFGEMNIGDIPFRPESKLPDLRLHDSILLKSPHSLPVFLKSLSCEIYKNYTDSGLPRMGFSEIGMEIDPDADSMRLYVRSFEDPEIGNDSVPLTSVMLDILLTPERDELILRGAVFVYDRYVMLSGIVCQGMTLNGMIKGITPERVLEEVLPFSMVGDENENVLMEYTIGKADPASESAE